ncbi:MAG: ABC transporter permease [Pseudomonadota bacterium]
MSRRRSLGTTVALVVLVLVVGAALFGDFLTAYPYDQSNLLARNEPPVFLGGTWDHPLGTDRLGRDMVARLVVAIRISIGIAAVGTLISMMIGTSLGLLAARRGKAADDAVMGLVDLQAALPFIIIALAILAFFGRSLVIFIMLIGLYGWEVYARQVRGAALAARNQPYIEAAKAVGVATGTIYRRHILPNISNVIIVQATLNFPQAILLETGLSFLGLGIQPPLTSLGQLLGEGRDSLASSWWVAVIPGTVIFLTTLAVSLLGDALRDRLDPTLRR